MKNELSAQLPWMQTHMTWWSTIVAKGPKSRNASMAKHREMAPTNEKQTLNQTGSRQKFAPPQKGLQTKDTCRNGPSKPTLQFFPCPQFQCCAMRVFAGANFCPENARAHGSQKQTTLKLGGRGETQFEQNQQMEWEEWCELSSDTSTNTNTSKKDAMQMH